ncbi:CHAT domain protein [Anatilimnocola aggregata]|uniref:CHAT domain protein n=1 Tax=Anatilimnocola aggregata TaxID=2528021 RepID=A0A517Y4D0_9BACT|nr:CHAT domain-containing protein [Anatilimnocola aggregata]QDU25103.1 CHAT domain protein [Anatilimnocola aggregata]
MNTWRRFNKICVLSLLILWSLSVTSSAQEPNGDDWQAYLQLQFDTIELADAGKVQESAASAERLNAHLQNRFPKRLHFLAKFPQGRTAEVQAKYEEALASYQEFLSDSKGFQPRIETERLLVNSFIGDSLHCTSYCLSQLARYDEAVPFAQAAVDWKRKYNADQPLVAAESEKQMALLFRDMRDLERAEKHFRQAAAVFERAYQREQQPIAGFPHLLAGWASIYEHRGRYDLAEPLYRRALSMQLAISGWQHNHSAECANNLATVYMALGRHAEARQYAEASLVVWEKLAGKTHIVTMQGVQRMAMIDIVQGREEEAIPLMRRVASVYEEKFGAAHPFAAQALVDLGQTLMLARKYDEADLSIQKGLDALTTKFGAGDARTASGLYGLAIIKLKQGNPQKALTYLDQIDSVYALHPPDLKAAASVHRFRAEALWELKDQAAAVKELQRALDLLELQRGNAVGAERERATYMAEFAPEFESMIQWQAELGNMPALFVAIEQMKARSFLDELRLKGADLLEGSSAAERQQLAKRENELRVSLASAEREFEAVAHVHPETQPELAEKRSAALTQLLHARDALYRHIADARSSSPVVRKLVTDNSQAITLSDVQAQLREDEVLLAYSIGTFRTSQVMVIRRTTATSKQLAVDAAAAAKLGIEAGPIAAHELTTILQDKDEGVLPALSSPESKINVDVKLATLWQVLVPESVRQELTSGNVKLLTIIPDGPLALLPFEALIVSSVPGEDEPQYLLDVGPPISYAPSAAVMLNLAKREPATQRASQPLFTLGDPTYPQVTQSSAERAKLAVDEQFRAGLSRLPYTGSESIWVQQWFEKAGLAGLRITGTAATEGAIREHVAGREIVHLACHGMADRSYGNFYGALAIVPGKPGDPRDDGLLSMSEIYELNLTGCELAILSACETNYGPQQQGEGVWALSRSFLVAGSKRVVASNWVVDDAAGATLVSYFANYLARDGKDPIARNYASALHNAKKHVRKEEKWKHPFYWSSLVLVGPK